jgi:formylglycine-generating enzyme required for sulfatase activity
MVPIKGGSFLMGNERSKNTDESPQKEITLSSFWMGAFEVTRDELDTYLKDDKTSQNEPLDAITRPSPQYVDLTWGMGKEGGYPANSMSQHAAIMYCRWLYEKTKIFYRLPTEAEWEYACKAGTTATYFFGNNPQQLAQYAWYEKNSDEKYHKVGQKLPNPWGLYDILGNVAEWTMDQYSETTYLTMAATNPMVTATAKRYPKVVRGGSYMEDANNLTSTKRNHSVPAWNNRDPQVPKSKWWLTEAKNVGFRLVRPLEQPDEATVKQFFKSYLNL